MEPDLNQLKWEIMADVNELFTRISPGPRPIGHEESSTSDTEQSDASSENGAVPEPYVPGWHTKPFLEAFYHRSLKKVIFQYRMSENCTVKIYLFHWNIAVIADVFYVKLTSVHKWDLLENKILLMCTMCEIPVSRITNDFQLSQEVTRTDYQIQNNRISSREQNN